MTVQNLNANKTDFEQLKKQKPLLEKQYIYFQEIKAYIRDFIDCYNEKMVDIEKTEANWLNLFRQRAERLLNRRLQDIKDQNLEASNSNLFFFMYIHFL
jgi:GC-rich sequence DNA-binding factor